MMADRTEGMGARRVAAPERGGGRRRGLLLALVLAGPVGAGFSPVLAHTTPIGSSGPRAAQRVAEGAHKGLAPRGDLHRSDATGSCPRMRSALPGDAPTATPVAGTPEPVPAASLLGRYRLLLSSSSKLAHRGNLTLFMRSVPGQPAPVLSGILALYGPRTTNVLYLTQFSRRAGGYAAVVNAGIYTGPVIGQFIVDAFCNNRMEADLLLRRQTKLSLDFLRFSTNPHP
ncbi:MAG: hypothetical protein JOZ41_04745 [Chloroflexi bacterium]|nr:hypothetical protein [Chloroflexota bacterium]